MELIRKLVPSAEETPFIRLSLLLQNVIQHVLEEMHAGGAAAEVVDAGAHAKRLAQDCLPRCTHIPALHRPHASC